MDPEDFLNMMNHPQHLAVLQRVAGMISQQGAMAILNNSKPAKTAKPEPSPPEPVGYDINRPYNPSPNFTILTPGACNAKCGFCFWNHEQGKLKPMMGTYRLKLKHNLTALPSMYRNISISGGEPTLSPYLPSILATIASVSKNTGKFNRVVLTTNGVGLIEKEHDDPWFSMLICTIKHLNISRHHFDDVENFKIFKTSSVPTTKQLADIILKVQQANILFGTAVDVTLNCVIDDSTTEDFCYQFIEFAQTVGAHAVSFRKQASTVDPTPVEQKFMETLGKGEFNNCPVCRGRQHVIDGYQIRWKGSVNEPSLVLGKVYEAIMHANGDVYADWGMKEKLRVYTDDTVTPGKTDSLEKMYNTLLSKHSSVPKGYGLRGNDNSDSFVGSMMGASLSEATKKVKKAAVVGCGSSGCG
jgi:organic radical activating enzyme